MEWENIQKPFLRRRAMGHDPAVAQGFPDLWPELSQRWGVADHLVGNAMHFARCPCHRARGFQIRVEHPLQGLPVPMNDRDLDGFISKSRRGSGAFKVDRRKPGLSDFQALRSAAVVSQSMQASVMETPYCKIEGSCVRG